MSKEQVLLIILSTTANTFLIILRLTPWDVLVKKNPVVLKVCAQLHRMNFPKPDLCTFSDMVHGNYRRWYIQDSNRYIASRVTDITYTMTRERERGRENNNLYHPNYIKSVIPNNWGST